MKKIYLSTSLVLGIATVLALVYALNYSYKESSVHQGEIAWKSTEVANLDKTDNVKKNADIIFEKNIFDINRGKEEPSEEKEEPEFVDFGRYTVELRGINIVGNTKIALLTATEAGGQSRRNPFSRGSAPVSAPEVVDPNAPPPVRSTSSNPILVVKEGEVIGKTGHKVASIEKGKVFIKDHAGKQLPPLEFNLLSASSLKRADLAFKEEQQRQKELQLKLKQAEVIETQQPLNPGDKNEKLNPDPTKKSMEEREIEVRKKAEALREEMLKMREERRGTQEDSSTSTNGDSSSDKKIYKKDR